MSDKTITRYCVFDNAGLPLAMFSDDIYPSTENEDGTTSRHPRIVAEAVVITDDEWTMICREPYRVVYRDGKVVILGRHLDA